jgi:site-specific DNA recombinase
MEPELVAAFVAEFAAEWNRLRAEASAGLIGRRRELEAVERKLVGLIDEIADGLRKPGLLCRLDELEQRKQDLRSEIMAAEAGPELPRLHRNLAEVYRAKVARLRVAFLADGGTETLEAARSLIDRVEVHPPAEPGGKPRLELLGELSMMLRLASGAQQKGPELNGLGPGVMSSVKGDAGTGFEPVTFRL